MDKIREAMLEALLLGLEFVCGMGALALLLVVAFAYVS